MVSALDSAILRRLMKTAVNTLPLSRLADALAGEQPSLACTGPDVTVAGLCADSRRVAAGDLFIAASGTRDDGLRFLPEALARGAVAVLSDRARPPELQLAWLQVPDLPRARALVAAEFFGHPARRLATVGITGTNGKTTTSFMLRSMLVMDGQSTGLIGTLGAHFGRVGEELANTTPDAVELQRLLARMVDANLQAAVLEVSSHALVQRRADAIDFDVGVFTNLSTDHLDYHGTLHDYRAAKGRLFEGLGADATAVLNARDPASRLYALSTSARVLRYAVNAPADVRADLLRLDAQGTAFRLTAREWNLDLPVTLRLVGRHNVENALAAAGAALALGLPASAIVTGLAALSGVPGRLEAVECGQDFRVLVDYAHTPDALEQVLDLLRPLTGGRLAVVFGCGGDRDRSKRPAMGRAAAEAADRVYLTSDNPRSEDPQAILDEVLAGVPDEARSRVTVCPDRREAIARVCAEARGGDVVLLAGKGHETTQTIGSESLPFDDRSVVREILWKR